MLRLLEHAKKNKLIADGTFKLNWNGLPVALTGTVDMRYREKLKIMHRLCNTLLVDYAGAITNGFIIGYGYAPEF